MNDEEFNDLKKKVLPSELQEHFTNNKRVFQNNIKRFQNLTKQLGSTQATDEEKALLAFILDLGESLYGSADVLLEHTEIAYFGIYMLRDVIDTMRTSLESQGIKVDRLLTYEKGLKFVDDYIKHSSNVFKP